MIDIKKIRANAETFAKREYEVDLDQIIAHDCFVAGAQWAIEAMCKQYIESLKASRERIPTNVRDQMD